MGWEALDQWWGDDVVPALSITALTHGGVGVNEVWSWCARHNETRTCGPACWLPAGAATLTLHGETELLPAHLDRR